MKRIFIFTIAGLILSQILSSCNVTSDNPVNPESSSEVDPAPYIGMWNLQSIAGETPQQAVSITIQESGDNIVINISDGSTSSVETGILARVDSNVIVSVQGESGLWNVNLATINSTSNELTIYDLNRETLRADIEADLVDGEVDALDTNYFSVHLTADSASIRSYLDSQTNIFYTEGMIFTR